MPAGQPRNAQAGDSRASVRPVARPYRRSRADGIHLEVLIDGFENRPGVHLWQGGLHAATLAWVATRDGKGQCQHFPTRQRSGKTPRLRAFSEPPDRPPAVRHSAAETAQELTLHVHRDWMLDGPPSGDADVEWPHSRY